MESVVSNSERYFGVAFGGGPVPMTLTEVSETADRVILEANQAMADLLGYSVDTLRGMSFVELTHPDDLAEDNAGTESQTDGSSEVFTGTKRYIRADGEIVWVRLHVAILDKADDRIVTVGHAINITEEVRAMDADRRRQALSDAVSKIRHQQLSDHSRRDSQLAFATSAKDALKAKAALVFHVDPATGTCDMTIDLGLPDDVRLSFASRAPLAAAVAESGEFVRSAEGKERLWPELDAHYPGTILAVPCTSIGGSVQVLCVIEPDLENDEEAAISDLIEYAGLATLAVELADARAQAEKAALHDDRDRIGREIHDRVIGRLFATGMSLQAGLAGETDAEVLRSRIESSVGDIDEAIKDIRNAIYARDF